MADLIELNISVKDQSVKQAVTTVSRLEREIIKAVKAVDSHQISQKRFDQILAKSKQEYKAYAGNAGLATININKFVKAQREAAQGAARVSQSVDRASQSSVRYAAAARSAGDATNRTRQAFLNTANSIAIMDGPLGGVASRFSAFGVLIGRTGILLGSLAVTLSSLGLVFAKGFRDLVQYEVQMAKIEGVLKTTGNQAGLTARDIEIMSSRIAMATLESEEAIRSAATQLLTFKNVGKDVFETTLKAATDMAALGFGTVESEAVKLAKALEDPRQSLTSLSRSGITFTRQQRQLITSLVESGRQAEAMDRILANVNRQVGGAGEAAARTTMAGAFDTIGQAVRLATRNFAESTVEVTGLDKALSALAATAGRFVEADNLTLEDQIRAAREQVALLGPELEAALNRESASFFSSAFLERGQRGSAIIQYELDLAKQLLEVTTNRLEEEGRISAVTQARTQMQERSNALDNLQAEADAIRENIGLTEQQIRVNKALAAEGLLGLDISKEMDDYVTSLREAQTPQAELVRRAEEFYQVLTDSVGVAEELAEALDLAELGRQFVNNSRSIEDQNSLLESQLALMDDGISASEARRQAELNLQLAQAETLRLAKEITDEDFNQLRAAILKNQALSADLANRTAAPARAGRAAAQEISDLQKEINKLNETAAKGLTPFDKYNTAIKNLNVLRASGLSQAAYSMEIERLNEELAKSLPLVDDLSDAFGDFLARGLTDFKSFANSIFKSFQNMLAQMIATAARNKILISMGATSTAAGPASAASNLAQGAGMMGNIGAATASVGSNMMAMGTTALGMGGAFTGSFGAGMAATMTGGVAGGASAFATGASMMGTAATAASGAAMAIGAIAPPLLALAVVLAIFSKKVKTSLKEIDSGVSGIVKGFDVAIKNFSVIEKTVTTSRFFGLSKKTSVSTETVYQDAPDSPLIAAVAEVQQAVVTAAEAFGFGADAFNNFSYEFKVSLKGLSEDQKMQKINEELTRMGDAFADMLPHFSSMNELLEAAEHRYQIENRMLEALGRSTEVVIRNRERELAATHALNRGLLQATFNLEDANAAVSSAMEGLRRAIDAEKAALQTSFDAVFDGLRERLDLATEAVSRSRNIFNMLSNALKSRALGTMEESMFRRSSALSFLQSGDISDEKKLESALQVVAEPSEGLFGSFVDYAREFLQTSRVIGDLEKTAAIQLTADEKAVVLLEQQIEANKAALDSQLVALDQQYQIEVDQFNALLGIDTSVKSVGEAIATLRGAIEALASAQAAAKAAQAAGVGGGASGGSISQFSTGKKFQGFDLLDVGGASGLLQAAGLTGVSTSGRTGLQIAQDIANATGQAVQLDAASRVQKFARGGMFGGGMRMVGEEGPELEVTGPSRIYSKQQTKELLRGGDSNESEGLRTEVSELRQELRQLLIANNKYTKRSYDLYNKWDIDGLPAERT